MLSLDGLEIDEYVSPPEIDFVYRARSVVYSLDGSAHEDRLGGAKKQLKLTFALCLETKWEEIRLALTGEGKKSKGSYIEVAGSVGETDVSGNYRLVENTIPTPVIVVTEDGMYYVGGVTVTIEEV